MSKNPKWKTWLQWYEVNGGSRTTIDQFRELLKKYNRSSLLVLCAQLSVAFAYGPEGETSANDELTKRLIVWLFPPVLVSKIEEFAKQDRIIFFQAQLRYVAAEVIRGADTTEGLPAIENLDVGELLLRASELMYLKHPDQPDPFDQLANRISQFLPIYEIDLPNDPFMLQLRFYIFLTVNIPRLPPEKRIFDVDKLFKDHFGFELTTFRQFMYAFGMHALMMRMDENPSRGTEDCGLRVSTFKNATVPHELINAMFATVSFSWESLKKAKKAKGYADFDFLKDQPYFRFKEALYCLDYEFGMGKLESSVIWRIVKETMDKNKGDEYLGYWGYVFEDYVAWLFETYSLPRFNEVCPSPKYVDDPSKEICDTIIICGSTAILIESKLATCASAIRYGGDYAAMRDFLEERLVTTVGVHQLRTAIDNLTSLPAQSLPAWLAGVTKFIPVIITKDDIGSCWYVNKYLNDRFEGDLNRKKYKGISICPLVSMSIASLERCMKELRSRHFSDVLEQRIQANRDMIWTLEMASKYVGRGPARNLPEHIAILHKYSEEMIAGLGIHD